MATALITGASGGIGAEFARILARRGDEVVVVQIRRQAGRTASYGVSWGWCKQRSQ